jgi:hypothetical protein
MLQFLSECLVVGSDLRIAARDGDVVGHQEVTGSALQGWASVFPGFRSSISSKAIAVTSPSSYRRPIDGFEKKCPDFLKPAIRKLVALMRALSSNANVFGMALPTIVRVTATAPKLRPYS